MSSERAPRASSSVSRVAPGTKVKGEISGAAELLIEGEVEGQVRIESSVTVGNEGLVNGEIYASDVRVGGKVTGNVRGRRKVEILASGVVQGDVRAPRVVIAEGAFLRGRVEMVDDQQQAQKAPSPQRTDSPQPSAPPVKPAGAPGLQRQPGS